MLRSALLSLPFAVVAVGPAVGPPAPTVLRDLAYGEGEHAVLDLYLPAGEPEGLLVFVHGGSWVGGDKDKLALAPDLIDWAMDRHLVLAAPNFRQATTRPSSAVTWREQCADLARALAWLDTHAPEHGLGEEPGLVLMGFSSGAHLVALLGTDPFWLETAGLPFARIGGVISLDVHAYDIPRAMALMRGTDIARNIPRLTWLFGNERADQLAASPASYLEVPTLPPALVISADPATPGTKGWVAREASAAYAQHRTAAGHPTTHLHFDDQTHSGLVMAFGASHHGPTQAVEVFLAGLGGGPAAP